MTDRDTAGTAWKSPSTVDEYLAELPRDIRDVLEQLRGLIRFTVPEARERIAYRIPVFSVKRDLVGFGGFRNHCSFYTMSPGLVKAMSEELQGYHASGSTIHFTPENPLPASLVTRILLARLRELEEKR
ncbi:MAG: DUF1801 domain-containing protein [Dehalococcoidia bacterium]|nr:DUF1801 domain-containing protein [Dehalococcoidia bacterium]